MERECKVHGLTDFFLRSGNRKGYRCRKCASEAVSKRRKKIKLMAVEYKGGKCIRCGYNKCLDALEFHHRDPEEKDFDIQGGGYTRAWEKIKIELDKCDLLCSNCHKEVHDEMKKK